MKSTTSGAEGMSYMKVIACLSTVLLLAAVGCADEFTYVPDSPSVAVGPQTEGNLSLLGGQLGGSFGDRQVSGPTTTLEGYSDQYGSSVTAQRDESANTGMLLVYSTRDLSQLEPGSYPIEADSDTTVTVCSGENGSIDFDAPSEGTMEVTDRPDGTRQVDLTVTDVGYEDDSFAPAPQGNTATGSFRLQPTI
jgi:hypothetical protein